MDHVSRYCRLSSLEMNIEVHLVLPYNNCMIVFVLMTWDNNDDETQCDLGSIMKVEHEDDWELRVGGALISTTGSVIQAEDGVIVIVNTLLIDYSRINVSDIGAAELVVDIGPFARDQVSVLIGFLQWNLSWRFMIDKI